MVSITDVILLSPSINLLTILNKCLAGSVLNSLLLLTNPNEMNSNYFNMQTDKFGVL